MHQGYVKIKNIAWLLAGKKNCNDGVFDGVSRL